MARRDVAGNSVASAAEYQRQMVMTAEQLLRFERIADRLYEEGVILKGWSVRFKGDERGDYLVVIRMGCADGAFVAFHSGETLVDSMRGAVAALENGSVRWKADNYAS